MKNIAVIPARSGSKGLKNKNIKSLLGKPLLAYSVEAALESGLFDCVHVSTDSQEYAEIAKKYEADVPFLRIDELSTDEADTWETLRFVIKRYKEIGKTFDTVTLLQPTSPLRGAQDICNAFKLFIEKEAHSVISVCEVEHSFQICNTLGQNDCMKGFIDTRVVGRRQELPVYYRLNGAIYIQRTELLMERGNLYGEKSFAYKMDKMSSIDIDDEFDFFMTEEMMKKRNVQKGQGKTVLIGE